MVAPGGLWLVLMGAGQGWSSTHCRISIQTSGKHKDVCLNKGAMPAEQARNPAPALITTSVPEPGLSKLLVNDAFQSSGLDPSRVDCPIDLENFRLMAEPASTQGCSCLFGSIVLCQLGEQNCPPALLHCIGLLVVSWRPAWCYSESNE